MKLCSQSVEKRNLCKTRFAGQELWLDAAKIIYWPSQQTLLVADLHFEKGSYFAKRGSALPCLDTMDTLHRLAEMIANYKPDRVICLGDSFHDKQAFKRLKGGARNTLNKLIAHTDEWHWIVGNHDPDIPNDIAGYKHSTMEMEGILLTHEPLASPMLQIIGHFHPKINISLAGHKVRGACFVHDEHTMILPSFGSYTGGLNTSDPVIQRLFTTSPRYYLIYRDKIWKLQEQ